MKKLIAMILSLVMLLSLLPAVSAAETGMTKAEAEAAVASLNANSDFYYELAEEYADSEIEYRTEVRWWMAEGGHTDETLEKEVQAMYDAGFRGVELCQLAAGGLDATVYGYGSEQWNHDFHLVLNKCLDLGMTVGITSGTNWNTTNVPGLNPDSQQAMQCAFEMDETFEAGKVLENYTIPTSKTTTSMGWNGMPQTSVISVRDVNQWLGAYAFEILDNAATPVILGNMIDLNEFVTENEDGTMTLNWTVPEGENSYKVFYYWMQGTAQQSSPSVVSSYCVNYLDTAGFDAWAEYFSANVLNDPALNEKILKGDVQLFMDSLEYSNGAGVTLWSQEFAKVFKERKGYDVTPYIMLTIGLPNMNTFEPAPAAYGTYNLADANVAQRIINDIFDLQTELYMENFMEPIEQWLNQYGISLRAQISYGKYLEISEPSMSVDYPEAENLNQRNQVDIYRLWTGAAKLENKVLSSETSAIHGMGYSYTFQKHLQEAYSLYAAGFSRINWHIWSSEWAPDVMWNGKLSWPGYSNMFDKGLGCFPTISIREIGFDFYKEWNQHLGRVQELLREGSSRTDVGMPRIKYGQAVCTFAEKEYDMWMQRHDYMLFPSMELQENGYTYDYFSPELFNSEDVYFDAETGTLELAGYKALVLWQEWLSVDGAQKILDFAKQGLKVVIVDGAAVQTPYEGNKAAEEAQLAEIMAELKTLSTVKSVATADDVLEALQALGVTPYAGFAEANQQLLTQSREDENGNRYLYVYNYCDGSLHDGDDADHGTNANVDFVLDGTFIPYAIDSWSGEVTQVANYRWEDGKTIINIDLDYGNIEMYGLEAVDVEPEHVVASDAVTYVTEDGIVVRATESGTYETELAYGRTVKTTVEVPEAYEITGWDVTVESWTEGEAIYRQDAYTDSKGNTTREMNVSTVKTPISFKLDKLTTWDNIPEVGRDVSGQGFYKAAFNWDGTADGAYLDFGALHQAMDIYINGKRTSDLNLNAPMVDISDLLVVGENTIEITYYSTWTNQLITAKIIKETPSYGGFFRKLWGGYDVAYRSYGPAQAVVVPYVEENISVLENNAVTVALAGPDAAILNDGSVEYGVVVSGAENLATATLTFAVEGYAGAEVVPAEGWQVLSQTCEDGVLKAVLYTMMPGVSGDVALASVVADIDWVGAASVELTAASLSAYVDDSETFVNVIFGETAVETEVNYHPCDVNRDGVVNQLDITRAQRFFGIADEICDVTGDGIVNTADMIMILNNYTA